MKKKKHMNIPVRRRREFKTDYRARRNILRGEIPRLIVRKTNRYLITQIVKSSEAQDSVVFSANSKELKNYGYNFSFSNTSAAYLTGFLIGMKAKGKIQKAILDLGLQRSTKGSKLYAAVKGFSDSGINIPHSAEILPSEDRIRGKHTGKEINIDEIKKKIEQGIVSKAIVAKKGAKK